MGHRRGIGIAALLIAATITLIGAAGAGGFTPKITCKLSPEGELSIDSNGPDAELRREHDAIVVSGLNKDWRCSGGPVNVHTVDTISLGEVDTVIVDLRGGPFAPGRTPEDDGSDEIEFEPGSIYLEVDLGNGDDRVVLGEWNGEAAVDLTAADGRNEPEISAFNPFFGRADLEIRGNGGDDLLTTSGGGEGEWPGDSPLLQGGPGDDRLRTVDRGWGGLIGGPGDDALRGGAKLDLLFGGQGRDVILGGRGRDIVNADDGGRDRVDCGGGRDYYGADRKDRVRRCEDLRPDEPQPLPTDPF